MEHAEHSAVEHEALVQLMIMQRRDYKYMDHLLNIAKDDNIKDMEHGRWALNIPLDHFKTLMLAYPLLEHPDNDTNMREWKRVCKMDFMLPYKLNKNQRSM